MLQIRSSTVYVVPRETTFLGTAPANKGNLDKQAAPIYSRVDVVVGGRDVVW